MGVKENSISRLSTGIAGLDEVLRGGLIPGQAYLLRGGPGTGKTTLGLHFLAAGAAKGEKTLHPGGGGRPNPQKWREPRF